MIRTLEEAREWHASVKRLAALMQRLARRYWAEEDGSKTLAETIHRDNEFRSIEAAELEGLARRVLEDLDDLAVLLIFSVFEADVRSRASEELKALTAQLPEHPVLKSAIDEARERIESGSFFKLTESYGASDADLRTQVDQVRRYRNWVAHGRRDQPQNDVRPDQAIQRLSRFLALLDGAP